MTKVTRATRWVRGRSTAPLRILAGGAIVAIIAACGGGGGGDDGGGGGNPTPAGNPPSVTAEPRALGEVGSTVTLTATASDPDGDAISYSWQQDSGEAASDTSGFDTATAAFTAPDTVDTLVFTVTATAGGQSDSAVVRVVVVEDNDTAVFVDGGFTGTPDGSIDGPYASLEDAVAFSIAEDDDSDFYIKALPGDDSYTLWASADDVETFNAQSFYGGYGANWERDTVGNRTRLGAIGRGIQVTDLDTATTVSGIALQVAAPDQDTSRYRMFGIYAAGGTAPFVAENNTIIVNGPDGTFDNPATSLFGVWLHLLPNADLVDNVIETGNATLASDRSPVQATAIDGVDGGDATDGINANGAAGGARTGGGWNGGDGGDGARTSFAPGDDGGNGSGRSSPVVVQGGDGGGGGIYSTTQQVEGPGADGDDGQAGVDGDSGVGGIGRDIYLIGNNSRTLGYGEQGDDGWGGGGGGGGGGGSGASAGRNGGGGGGGGEGGDGGAGGDGAEPGGASVAVVVFDVGSALIARNNLTAGNGGLGGLGGTGGDGGNGGLGGEGAPANLLSAAHGGDGGDGGEGGQGGYGGGGAGGPSYGIWVGEDIGPVIEENTIVAGRGGDGAPPRRSFEAAAAGGGGWAYGIIDANVGDGVSPVVSNNTITAGTGGDNGHADNPPGDSGDTRLQ